MFTYIYWSALFIWSFYKLERFGHWAVLCLLQPTFQDHTSHSIEQGDDHIELDYDDDIQQEISTADITQGENIDDNTEGKIEELASKETVEKPKAPEQKKSGATKKKRNLKTKDANVRYVRKPHHN